MKPVYSPCKDSLPYKFNGVNKTLEPGGSVFDDEGEARHVVKKFDRFGVCFMKAKMRFGKPVKKDGKVELDKDAIKEADAVWKVKNREWAEEVVEDFHQTTRTKREAGIKVEKPSNVVKAAKFLGISLGLLLSALLIAPEAAAQATTSGNANYTYKYDVESSTVTYCRMEGQNSDPYGQWLDGRGQIETSGSSTTVTGVNAADDVFIDVGVGDTISIRGAGGTVSNRVIVTNADNDTITVDTAIDLSGGTTWSWKRLVCGTGVTAGWVDVESWLHVQMGVIYAAGDVTALAVTWECRSAALGAAPQRVYPGISSDCGDGTLNGTVCEFATVGDALTFKLEHSAFSACRVGVAWVTADGATRDEVTVTLDVAR